MSLLITDYNNFESLNLDVDGLIINSLEYSVFNGNCFKITEFKKICEEIRNNHKLVIINCDRIIPEENMDKFLTFVKKINKLSPLFDYLIYSDMAFVTLFIDKDKLIYDPKTLVCSYKELTALPTKAFLSSELSLKEIKNINKENVMFSLEALGYRQMMYSRRPLLSLVMPKQATKKNTLYDLKEETRDNLYKIYERKRDKDNYGTFIYNYGIFVILKELAELKDNILFIKLNSLFIEKIIDQIVPLYKEFTLENENKLINILKENNLIFDRGFLDQESVLLKDDENL